MMLVPLLSAWVLGVLVVASVWPRRKVWREFGLILPLGAGVGLGITSALFYAASLTPWAGRVSVFLEASVMLVAILWLRRRWVAPTAGWELADAPATAADDDSMGLERSGFWLLLAAGVTVVATLVWRTWEGGPNGGWDAWAIWNMRARMMVRLGDAWPAFSAQPALLWSHPDYPLLVSASVARGWTWLGEESALYAAAVSVSLMLAAAGFLGAVLRRLAGFQAAAIGGVLLLGTPSILTMAATQYADIPQGYFYLVTFGLFALARREGSTGFYLLTGLCLGLAAWTKNEGLLFSLVTGLAVIADAFRRRVSAGLLPMAVGLAVGLLPVIAFKVLHAPPNDIVSGAGNLWENVLDGERHALIAKAFWRDLRGFGGWVYFPGVLMVGGLVWSWLRRKTAASAGLLPATAALFLTWAGYYVVYLMSPRDLTWHLNTSLGRLYQQLWPAAVFLWSWQVLRTSADEGSGAEPSAHAPVRSRRLPWAWLAPGMLGIALATGYGLSLQLKDQELTRVRLARGEALTAVVGGGWYGLEVSSKHRWFWSSGSGSFILQREAEGARMATRFGFNFSLRSLDRRPVKIMLGDRVVWEGVSDIRLQHFQVRDVPLPEVSGELRFISDAPGIPEAETPDARSLAFAVYNFVLKP